MITNEIQIQTSDYNSILSESSQMRVEMKKTGTFPVKE